MEFDKGIVMILQSLVEYYDLVAADANSDIPRIGYSRQKVNYALVIDANGRLVGVDDLQTRDGKKLLPRSMILPGGAKPSGSGIHPNFMWDNAKYLLGWDPDDPERASKQFKAFRDSHVEYAEHISDPKYEWFCSFLSNWDPESTEMVIKSVAGIDTFNNISSGFFVVRLAGQMCFLHELSEVMELWKTKHNAEQNTQVRQCLITGETGPIAQLHGIIKGVKNAQSSGARIVSFNAPAYCSYNKEQSLNAPVSETTVFKYATALNYLLARSQNTIQIADATTVFWTGKPTPFEDIFGILLNGTQDKNLLEKISCRLRQIKAGEQIHELGEQNTPFYILGLSPNASRISVRFWLQTTLGRTVENVRQHYCDLEISSSRRNVFEFAPMWLLLRSIALQGEDKNIPCNIAGHMMRCILEGTPYPISLLSAVVQRCRADHDIENPYRAAIIKAVINRKWRNTSSSQKEIQMALDMERSDPAYRLGRLFAAMEKAQSEALGEVNTTIKDRFFSSASSTPSTVFPRLLRGVQYHLAKLENGRRIMFEKLIQDILNPVTAFPSQMNLEEQGIFILGYYHQRQQFFTKKETE